MSGIAGIFTLNGNTLDLVLLAKLEIGLIPRGPDKVSSLVSGHVGMVARTFDSPIVRQREGLVSNDGFMLAWDGRLDNREELLAAISDQVDKDQSDASLVLTSFLKWGTDCLPGIIGDFALSLWDPQSRALLLARDAIGTRTLFYHQNDERVLWSSTLGSLLYLSDIETQIEEEYVAGFLVERPDPGLTPYKNIYSVPPGTAVVIDPQGIQIRRFWKLDPNHEIIYGKDEQYEEHFAHLFEEAVRCRLQVAGPVWAELSGGLDSSSIVCMADRLMKQGKVELNSLQTVSYVFDDSVTSDERKFIIEVEAKTGKAGLHILDDECWLQFPFAEEGSTFIPSPVLCFAERHRLLCEAMDATCARTLLNGVGGDHLLWSGSEATPDLADLFSRGKLLKLNRRLLDWSRCNKTPYLELLWKGAIRPLLSRQILVDHELIVKVPAWLDKSFVERMNLKERILGQPDCFGFELPSKRQQSENLISIIAFVAADYFQDFPYLERSYPFLHRPLVEFLLAIPFEQILRPGQTRSLHRRALRELLPEKIALRKNKRGTDEALYRALARNWAQVKLLLHNARVSSYGFVDENVWRATLDRTRHGLGMQTVTVLKTLSLEFWLRALEYHSSKVRTAAASSAPASRSTAAA